MHGRRVLDAEASGLKEKRMSVGINTVAWRFRVEVPPDGREGNAAAGAVCYSRKGGAWEQCAIFDHYSLVDGQGNVVYRGSGAFYPIIIGAKHKEDLRNAGLPWISSRLKFRGYGSGNGGAMMPDHLQRSQHLLFGSEDGGGNPPDRDWNDCELIIAFNGPPFGIGGGPRVHVVTPDDPDVPRWGDPITGTPRS